MAPEASFVCLSTSCAFPSNLSGLPFPRLQRLRATLPCQVPDFFTPSAHSIGLSGVLVISHFRLQIPLWRGRARKRRVVTQRQFVRLKTNDFPRGELPRFRPVAEGENIIPFDQNVYFTHIRQTATHEHLSTSMSERYPSVGSPVKPV